MATRCRFWPGPLKIRAWTLSSIAIAVYRGIGLLRKTMPRARCCACCMMEEPSAFLRTKILRSTKAFLPISSASLPRQPRGWHASRGALAPPSSRDFFLGMMPRGNTGCALSLPSRSRVVKTKKPTSARTQPDLIVSSKNTFARIPSSGSGCTSAGKIARRANHRSINRDRVSTGSGRLAYFLGENTMRRIALDLAEYLQADLRGDPSLWLSGVAGPEDAAPEDLIYVDATKH